MSFSYPCLVSLSLFTVSQVKPFVYHLGSYDFVGNIEGTYLLMFANFATDNYTAGQWILFFLSSIFIPIIMLNLLIAIMSDTFARVSDSMIEADGKELNRMILE